MSDVMSFTEIDGQHVELLPARTLLQTLQTPLGRVDEGSLGGALFRAGGVSLLEGIGSGDAVPVPSGGPSGGS